MTLYILDTDHISLQQRAHPVIMQRLQALGNDDSVAVDLIKIYFDFWNAFCVSVEFGSYAARNMFP